MDREKIFEQQDVPPDIAMLTRAEMEALVYEDGAVPTDTRFSSEDRGGVFHFFEPRDVLPGVHSHETDSSRYFAVTKEDGVVAGIAKLEQDMRDTSIYNINYVTVDPAFRGKGHARKLIEQIFAFAQKKNVALRGSSRTEVGEERMGHIFDEYAEKTGVSYLPA